MPAPKKPANPNPNPPEDDDGGDDVEAFTPRQLEMINNTVTAAVTAHVKRGLKPIQDQLAPLLTMPEQLTAITERLAGNAAPAAGAGGQQPAAGAGAGAQPAKDDPEKIALKKRLDAIEQEREQERVQARNTKRDATLAELATKAGVDKNRLRGVVALLRDGVQFDKEGNPYMTVERHGLPEQVTLEVGAGEFFKSDEGKAYIAPASPNPRGGTGGGRGTTAASVTRRTSNAPAKGGSEAKQERQQAATQQLTDAIGELFSGGGINIGG